MIDTLIKDYLEYVERELGYTSATIDGYKYQFTIFSRHFGNVDVSSIPISDVRDYFRSEEERGLKVSSVNTARAVIRSFFYFCQYELHLNVQFDSKMIRNKKSDPSEIKVAGHDDIHRVLAVLEDPQDKLIAITLHQTCMRIGELVRLQVKHINGCEVKTLGKGRKLRPVSITPDLAEALQKHIEDNNISTGCVFRSRNNKGYSVSGLRNRFVRKLKPYGIYAGFHWYRHGGATDMMRNGADLFFLKEYLGHSDIRTTQRYLHITDAEKSKKFKDFYVSPVVISEVLT